MDANSSERGAGCRFAAARIAAANDVSSDRPSSLNARQLTYGTSRNINRPPRCLVASPELGPITVWIIDMRLATWLTSDSSIQENTRLVLHGMCATLFRDANGRKCASRAPGTWSAAVGARSAGSAIRIERRPGEREPRVIAEGKVGQGWPRNEDVPEMCPFLREVAFPRPFAIRERRTAAGMNS